MLEISKFVNSNFSWTKSDTLKLSKTDEIYLENFFKNIYKISEQQESFNSFMENNSIMNFIDFHNMDIDNLHNNKLFIKYGKFLPKGDLDFYIEDILSKTSYNKFNISALQEIVNDNFDLFKKSETDIPLNEHVNNLIDTIIDIFRTVLYNYFKLSNESLIEEENEIIDTNCITEEIDEEDIPDDEIEKFLKSDPTKVLPKNEDKQEEFIELTEVYEKIKYMKKFFNENKEDGNKILSYFEYLFVFLQVIYY